MKKVILSLFAITAFASCEPIQTISQFELQYEMWYIAPPITTENNESLMPILQAEGTISPIQLFRADEIQDSLFNVCDCDSVFTQVVAK